VLGGNCTQQWRQRPTLHPPHDNSPKTHHSQFWKTGVVRLLGWGGSLLMNVVEVTTTVRTTNEPMKSMS